MFKKKTPIILMAYCLLWTTSLFSQATSDRKSLLVERTGIQKWALLIGVNNYSYVNDLKFCGNDIVALQKQLLAVGFPTDHVTLMHEGAKERRYQPFKSNIEVELELLLGELDETGTKLKKRGLAEPGDMIIIVFSGHGIHAAGENKSYFCPIDAIVNKSHSMIPLDKIYKLLELSPAGVKLLMVDACRNDPRPGGQKAMKATNETNDFAKTLENPPKGILVLSSCAPGQVSWEDEDIQHGVFMNYVLEGLAGAADESIGDRNKRVSLLELYRYTSDKTKTYVARTRGQLQTPALKGDFTGDFEFGTLTNTKPDLLIAPFSKQEANMKQAAWAKKLKTDVVITNSLGMKMALIPPGEFMMGSPESEAGRDKNEVQHKVRISQPYYVGQHEITQGQWERTMGTTPWKDENYVKVGTDYAVTYVTWYDVKEFCHKLSQNEGRSYRLPTEAEWEYACRAGTESMYCFGDSTTTLNEYAWIDENSHDLGEKYPHRVGVKRANNFGLFDMHGNVCELCSDLYDKKYYSSLAGKLTIDPKGTASSSEASRVFRGGSWNGYPQVSRSAYRLGEATTRRPNFFVGFRIVCELD